MKKGLCLTGLLGIICMLLYGSCLRCYDKTKEIVCRECEVDTTSECTTKNKTKTEYTMKKVALTFDDGPHPCFTEQLLNGLKERGVVATFFVIGENADANPDILKRMQKEGHLIGNHTYSHMQLRKNNRKKYGEEILATNKVIKQITGGEVIYIRPPYGSWDKMYELRLNMIPVLWTVDPMDWCTQDADCIVERVISKVKENDIILLHDIYDSSVTAALEIVDLLQKEGYRFVTVDEILFD